MGDFNRSGRGGFSRDRDSRRPQMHDAICDDCGRKCQVPFKPTGNKPIFCNDCFDRPDDSRAPQRDNFNRQGGSRDGGRDRDMYSAVCDDCGKDCEVPFRPSKGKPIFCSRCFENHSEDKFDNRSDRSSGRDNFRSNDRGNDRRDREREMFNVVCDDCGKDCQVPFKPSSDKPIFCDNCFRGGENARKTSNDGNSSVQKQIDAINVKLDRILKVVELLIVGDSKTELTEKSKAKKNSEKQATKQSDEVEIKEEVEQPKKKIEKKDKAKETKKEAKKVVKKTAKKAEKRVEKKTETKPVKKATKKVATKKVVKKSTKKAAKK